MEQKIPTKNRVKVAILFFALFSFIFPVYTFALSYETETTSTYTFALSSAPETTSTQNTEITNDPNPEQIGQEMITSTFSQNLRTNSVPEISENENASIEENGEGEKGAEGEEEEEEEEVPQIADPIYPFNKAMYHFNDKLYFWVLKPVARGYSAVLPEKARVGVSNFFYNVTTPIRFVSSLLQLKMKVAGKELIRFVYNSTVGVLGFADAAKSHLDISRQDEDLGQAFGSYGIGHGFYIVWPFLGPSSLRDTVGKVGDIFLNPVSHVHPTEAAVAITAYDKTNETSLHIGDYEDFKKSAIDPYISMRDAYLQNRTKKVDE